MNKPIKTGIIGFGLSGQVFHAPFLHVHQGFEIKKVVERHDEKSKTIYTYVDIVKDYQELIDDSEIDLIVHCTPNIYHFPYVKDCLLAGTHVVIEKPFTPTAKEADELISIAESKGVKIFVYQNRRWDGDFLTIKKIIDSGELGEINYYEAHFDRFTPEPRRALWREEPQPGSGNLYDLGSHLIDQALHLFGQPENITADIQSQRDNTIVDDYFKLNLKYPNMEAVLTAGMLVKDIGPRYIIRGSKGTFTKYGIDPQEASLKEGILPNSDNWGIENPEFYGTITSTEKTKRIKTEPGNYMGFYDNVFDVLINKKEMAIKPVEARNVIAMIEQAKEISNNKP
ncbi:MAG: Gfo/Idh/MocA family oxidoreductase [Bacteroidales bacterium]|nr:Gfo/Idh/MocA family oxidoreductase [Bacteroidales bacterium]MCF8457764.1 Gfo/Idh/MocA family oxidoreductase [Bacteroidales bacterium]